MKGPPLRVLLAEDSALLRESVVALLERLGHEVVDAVGTAPALERAHQALLDAGDPPDIVLTDVRMPPGQGDDGLVAALRLRARHPGQPLMVLSQYVAEASAGELLGLPGGGVGYLLKDRISRIREVDEALATVAAGGTVIDPEVVQHLFARSRSGPLSTLTEREREVLGLMADGRSNSEIAATLFLSDAAVSKHVGNVFQKLGLGPEDQNRRVRAVLLYLRSTA